MRRVLLALLVLTLLAAAQPTQALVVRVTDGFFIEAGRLFAATAEYRGECNGPGVLTVVIHKPIGDDTRVAPAESTMAPDPCDVYCTGSCRVPFAWVVRTAGTLAGGGVAGEGVRDLQGPFQGGFLSFHDRPVQ